MKTLALLAGLLFGVLALSGIVAPSDAWADACEAQCTCNPAPTGATQGCLSVLGEDNTNDVSVCGNAVGPLGPSGCVCVGGVCLSNNNLLSNPTSIVGCVGPPC